MQIEPGVAVKGKERLLLRDRKCRRDRDEDRKERSEHAQTRVSHLKCWPVRKDRPYRLHVVIIGAMGQDQTRSNHQQLLEELQAERAAALARISRRLERLLEQLSATREQIAQAGADDRARVVAEYRELRRQAVKYRWYLEVQREALGLRQHQKLDEFYPIPPLEP